MEQIEKHERAEEPVAETPAKKKSAPTCSVCLELIYEPQVGTCGHSICAECVPEDGKCPYCRKITTFQTNYMLREILEGDYGEEYKQRRVADTPDKWVRRHRVKNRRLKMKSRGAYGDTLLMEKLSLVEKFFMVEGVLVLPQRSELVPKMQPYPDFKVVFGRTNEISQVHMSSILWIAVDNLLIWVF